MTRIKNKNGVSIENTLRHSLPICRSYGTHMYRIYEKSIVIRTNNFIFVCFHSNKELSAY